MSAIRYYPDGTTIAEAWDDASAIYTAFNLDGSVKSTRPYTGAEQAAAAAGATAATGQSNQATIQQQAQTALTSNRAYLAITTPTNAQVSAQVAALTRQIQALIRLALNQFDATN